MYGAENRCCKGYQYLVRGAPWRTKPQNSLGTKLGYVTGNGLEVNQGGEARRESGNRWQALALREAMRPTHPHGTHEYVGACPRHDTASVCRGGGYYHLDQVGDFALVDFTLRQAAINAVDDDQVE